MPIMSAKIEASAAQDLLVRDLMAGEAHGFAGLTAPALRAALAVESLPEGCFRLAAFMAGEPAGLLISTPGQDGMQELTSLMVAPRWRRQGVGHALLDALSERARRAGRTGLVTRWSDRLPRAADFASLLNSQGWSAPVETRRRMTWRVGDWQRGFPRRDGILSRLRAQGMVDRSLAALDARALEDLKRQNATLIEQGVAPDWSACAGWLPGADPDATVLLYDREDRLSGWMVVSYQPQFDRWFIPQGHVVPERVRAGWLIGAIASLWCRLEEKAGPDAILIAQPPAGAGAAMEKMLHRHFAPHALAMDFLLESERLFSPDGG